MQLNCFRTSPTERPARPPCGGLGQPAGHLFLRPRHGVPVQHGRPDDLFMASHSYVDRAA